MDQDERTTPAAGAEPQGGVSGSASRSQHTVYTLPHDWALIRRFLAPALERAQRLRASDASGPSVLVVASDTAGALAIARTAHSLLGEDGPAFIPVTAVGRATRLIRGREPIGVSGTPALLAELVRNAVLKLDDIETVVIAWADDLVAAGGQPELEAVLAELPKDGARVLVTSRPSEQLEELIERYMRKPRHISDPVDEEEETPLRAPLHYVTTVDSGRPWVLRRLLDELDPTSATIVAPSEDAAAEVRLNLASLGYAATDTSIGISDGAVAQGTGLVVLYELPSDGVAVRAAQSAGAGQVIALVQPRQLPSLRRLAGDALVAYTFGDAHRNAQAREEALRDEIRAELAEGAPTREVLALEPLLAQFDGVEVAAAVLRLLDEARRQRPVAGRVTLPAADDAPVAPWTKVFVNVGTKDGASAGDLLGALAGEGNVGREKIGRIELRETHAMVDISTDVVEAVVEAVTGAALRGRRLVARVDKDRATATRGGGAGGDRPPRSDRPRDDRPSYRGDRPSHGDGPRGDGPRGGGQRGERPSRGGSDRPPRSGPPRGDRDDRGSRPPRPGKPPFRSASEERSASYGRTLQDEQREWASRGDRIRNSRRSTDTE